MIPTEPSSPVKPVRRAVGRVATAVVLAVVGAGASSSTPRTPWDDADWAVFRGRTGWALEAGLDTVAVGDALAALGRTLVGTPHVPHTLEPPGPERLVIGFRALDCVTFVENVLGLALFVQEPDAPEVLQLRDEAERRYEEILTRIRYRGGRLQGFASRLHYFSDWIADGEAKGLVRDITRELGGVRDTDVVDYMSTHPQAYRQLVEDPAALASIREVEERLTSAGRWWIPEEALDAAVPRIRDGDIIAMTSTARGMDVAHVGFALWVDGSLRLLHAPVAGDAVEVSAEALPQRVRRIRSQDGIIVARARGAGASSSFP